MRVAAPSREEFDREVLDIQRCVDTKDYDNQHIKRAINLASAKGGGHDQFLTGIVVQFDLTVSQKCWPELQRYHFLDFVSSMSTMHRISAFNLGECCNKYVSADAVKNLYKLRQVYESIPVSDKEKKKEAYLNLLYNIPSGFELMAGMTTNYRQIKTMYTQRRKQGEHRLPDWWFINDWIETLPLAKELICVGKQ